MADEGAEPDRATICKFRTQFGQDFKSLFTDIGRVGIEMGLVSLNQVMLNGTDIRANNSRHNVERKASIQEKLAMLNQQIEVAMSSGRIRPTMSFTAKRLPQNCRVIEVFKTAEKLKQALAKVGDRA